MTTKYTLISHGTRPDGEVHTSRMTGTLRQRVLTVAAEVNEAAEIDGDIKEDYNLISGAVSASLDYASTPEEAEALQDEIERLQARQRALAAGAYIRNKRGE